MTLPPKSLYSEIPLTQGQVAWVDVEDYIRVSQYTWQAWWNPHTRSFYAVGWIAGRTVKMHRFILGIQDDDGLVGEHRNSGQTLDNRRENLRQATGGQNAKNRRRNQNNTSGFKGVYFNKEMRKWKAQIKSDGKYKFLGYADTAEKAYSLYCEAAKRLHGEFANLG